MFSEVRAYIISFKLSLTNNPSSAFFNEHVIIVSQRMNEQIVVITRASCSFLLRWRNEKQVCLHVGLCGHCTLMHREQRSGHLMHCGRVVSVPFDHVVRKRFRVIPFAQNDVVCLDMARKAYAEEGSVLPLNAYEKKWE